MEWMLLPIAFMTSMLTGALGLGGGVLLITLMPGLLPTAAIIPVHAAVQTASNASRVLLDWREVDRTLVIPLVLGAVAGASFGGLFYHAVNVDYLPVMMGVMILIVTWWPLPKVGGGGVRAMLALGFYQTGLGMIAGATGPLGAAVLLRRSKERDYLVVNTGVYMMINHLVRTALFASLGFVYSAWLPLLAALVLAVTAGSWAGARLRRFVPARDFHRWFRYLVSLLAIRMIAAVWW